MMVRTTVFKLKRVTVASSCILLASASLAQEDTCPDSFYQDRIVTPEEVDHATVPGSAKAWWAIGWPCRALFGAMEGGLIKFEEGKIREKMYDFQQRLAAAGFRPLFGGLGEGSGMGLGTIYDTPHRTTNAFHLLGRVALTTGYQEFGANYDPSPFEGTRFNALVNYQWRPSEQYYGFGRDSRKSDRSAFSLRQTSFSFHWDQSLHPRIRIGSVYTAAALTALPSERARQPPVDVVFGNLPGLNDTTKLQSIGTYLALDGYQGDYRLGGRGQFGTSWQQSWGGPTVRYAKIEAILEGRLPVARGRSVLVGVAAANMLREGRNSSPIPFYLYPRIGGGATLRGFGLDRFYDRSIILAGLEYRFLIHPNMEVALTYDSGQGFRNTKELRFLDWDRNYGFGFRFKNATGTQFRFEVASSVEGWTIHFSFGDRPIRPLGAGPVRYPLYRP